LRDSHHCKLQQPQQVNTPLPPKADSMSHAGNLDAVTYY
jgi:hypothetical protein